MKRFLTGASQAVGPSGLGSVCKWLIVGALTLGIAPASVQAQNMMAPARFGRPSVSLSFPMGGFSIWHILIFAIIILLLFGGNRFSAMMGDVAKGLKSFKQGMADEEEHRAAVDVDRQLVDVIDVGVERQAPGRRDPAQAEPPHHAERGADEPDEEALRDEQEHHAAIARAHGGTLELVQNGEPGAVFRLHLPRRAAE